MISLRPSEARGKKGNVRVERWECLCLPLVVALEDLRVKRPSDRFGLLGRRRWNQCSTSERVGLFVGERCWRFVRVGHGSGWSSDEVPV